MPSYAELEKQANELIAKAKSDRSAADAFLAEAKKRAADEKRDMKPDEATEYNRLKDAAKQSIADAESAINEAKEQRRLEDLDSWSTSSRGRKTNLAAGQPDKSTERDGVTEEHRSLALHAWIRHASGLPLTDDHEEACKRVGVNPTSREYRFKLPQTGDLREMREAGWGGGYGRSFADAKKRALQAGVGALGGYTTLPASIIQSLEVNMLAYGGILQVADTMRTASGEPMPWPTADDTGNTGRQIGEAGAATTATDPSFGMINWSAYPFTSDVIKVSQVLMEDSIFSIDSIVGEMIGVRLARILSTKFTTGTGSATPKGIVTAASAGVTTASSTAITWDEITNLIHTIDPAYRSEGAFMFHDGIYQHLRKLKDAIGHPLWADGPNSTPPALLQGYPYYISQEMASSVASSNVTMLFGKLSNYKVRMVNDVRLYRLDELYRANDQTGFIAFVRADGNLLTAGTAPVKKMAQL